MSENLLIAISGTIITSVTGLIVWAIKRDFGVYKKVLEIENSLILVSKTLEQIVDDLKSCQSSHID